MSLQLRKHQKEGLHFLLNNQRLGGLLWHEVGTGKTITALEAARVVLGHLRANGAPNPKMLIILPKSASITWRKECIDNAPDLWQSMILLPYSRMHEQAQYLTHQDVRVIICDESHYLKNPESGRAALFATMLEKISGRNGKFQGGKIIFLTGTPMLNSAAEFYSTWATLAAPNLLEASKRILDKRGYMNWEAAFAKNKAVKFKSRFGDEVGYKSEGVQNSDHMTQLLAPISHIRKAKDCIDLPDMNIIPIDLGLPDDTLLAEANIEKPEAYMALLERLSRAKAPHMMEWVKEFLESSNDQLVMFSMYLEPIYALQAKHPKKVVVITGAESSKEREANVLAFQSGKVRVIAMSYAAGAESLNLQNAHIALHLGYPWTDGKLKQALGRINRSGQKNKTMNYFLTSGFNDARILNLVRSKEEATTEVENSLQLHEQNNTVLADKNSLDDLF